MATPESKGYYCTIPQWLLSHPKLITMVNPDSIPCWMDDYLSRQTTLIKTMPVDKITRWIGILREANEKDRQIFVCGNGANAANASHFATDLGKGASDAMAKRFRILSLNDNTAWMTAIGNDYEFADVFRRQMENYARPDDILIASSVSGSSPNLVRAFEWANQHGMLTMAMIGAKRGALAELANEVIVVEDSHYGRVEDAQMMIYHMLCFAFIE